MAGLVPAIHVLFRRYAAKTWMPGTRPGMTTEGLRSTGRLPPEEEREGRRGLLAIARLRLVLRLLILRPLAIIVIVLLLRRRLIVIIVAVVAPVICPRLRARAHSAGHVLLVVAATAGILPALQQRRLLLSD